MFKVDRALKEVWEWKDKIYKETKASSIDKQIALICEQAKESSKGIKLSRATKVLSH